MLGLQSFRKEAACLAIAHLRKEAFLDCCLILKTLLQFIIKVNVEGFPGAI